MNASWLPDAASRNDSQESGTSPATPGWAPGDLKAYCALDEATLELLKMAMTELKLSARAYDRILKVARTIADLAEIGRAHV